MSLGFFSISPENIRKPEALLFPGDIKRSQWHKKGLIRTGWGQFNNYVTLKIVLFFNPNHSYVTFCNKVPNPYVL